MNSGLFCGSIEKNLSGFCLDEADDTEKCIRRDAYRELHTNRWMRRDAYRELHINRCVRKVIEGELLSWRAGYISKRSSRNRESIAIS